MSGGSFVFDHGVVIMPSTLEVTYQAPSKARLAQSAERKALNIVVVGSSPTVGVRLSISDIWQQLGRGGEFIVGRRAWMGCGLWVHAGQLTMNLLT